MGSSRWVRAAQRGLKGGLGEGVQCFLGEIHPPQEMLKGEVVLGGSGAAQGGGQGFLGGFMPPCGPQEMLKDGGDSGVLGQLRGSFRWVRAVRGGVSRGGQGSLVREMRVF